MTTWSVWGNGSSPPSWSSQAALQCKGISQMFLGVHVAKEQLDAEQTCSCDKEVGLCGSNIQDKAEMGTNQQVPV